MSNHLLKVTMGWISAVYAVCYFGVLLFPASRELFMRYALHTNMTFGENVFTLATFISGLIIWNIVAVLAVALWAYLDKTVRS